MTTKVDMIQLVTGVVETALMLIERPQNPSGVTCTTHVT